MDQSALLNSPELPSYRFKRDSGGMESWFPVLGPLKRHHRNLFTKIQNVKKSMRQSYFSDKQIAKKKKEKEATDEKRLTVNIIQKHYEPPCLESGLKTPTVFF